MKERGREVASRHRLPARERGFKLVSKDSIYPIKNVIYCNWCHLTVI